MTSWHLWWITTLSTWLLLFNGVLAGDLRLTPPAPSVPMGQSLTVTVTGTNGEVTWSASKGKIAGASTQATYVAPDNIGLDTITVADKTGNIGHLKVTVTAVSEISLKNVQWEVFTQRRQIRAMLLSEDSKTLWVATTGGLEKREARTGEVQQVFLNIDGLPDNSVTALLSDNDGGLWIGTENGLAHYTAQGQWEVFTQKNSSLVDNNISALLSNGQGGIWVGTDGGGLAHYTNQKQWQVFTQEQSDLPNDKVYALARDKNGNLWVGTAGGVAHFSAQKQWQVFTQENSTLPDNRVYSLLNDSQGDLWVGTAAGLARYTAAGHWQTVSLAAANLPRNEVWAILSDGSGGLWLGTGGGLVHHTAQDEWQVFNQQNSSLPGNAINSLVSDTQGGIWIGTKWDGLVYYTAQGVWQVFKEKNAGLLDNAVFSLLNDNQGNLLVSTGGGLTLYSTQAQWRDLFYDYVVATDSDNEGGLWLGVYGGGLVHLLASSAEKSFTQENSKLPSDGVNTLISDTQGGVWIGTGDGLAHYDTKGQWLVFKAGDLSVFDEGGVRALLNDGQEGVWVGTATSGLAHYWVNGEWQVFNTDNSQLPNNEVNALLSDNRGGVWVGTAAGLAHFTAQKQWQVYTTRNSGLLNDEIRSLLSDNQDGLWVGTNDGLAHFTMTEWQVFNQDNSGLPAHAVTALAHDHQNGLWIGTNGGLARLTFGKKNCAQLDEQDCETVLRSQHAAILIHPRGQDSGYNQAAAIEFMATYAYSTLYQRRFNHDEIYFLSYKPDLDFNGDDIADSNLVDAPVNLVDFRQGTPSRDVTRADVQAAFDWAKEKGPLNQPLVVVFVDHGVDGGLLLEPTGKELLTDEILKGMLDDYQQVTGNQVVVVLEACKTGTMLATLADPPRRLVITSTGNDTAYYDDTGRISFLKLYFDQLRLGDSYAQSLATAKEKLHHYPSPFTEQQPQFQGNVALDACLGSCVGGLPGILTLTPQIPSTFVGVGQTIDLAVDTSIEGSSVQSVWASVMTPAVMSQRNEEGFSRLPPLLEYLRKGDDNKWVGHFSKFTDAGEYTFTFKATDRDNVPRESPPVIVRVEGENLPALGTIASGGISVNSAAYQTTVVQNLADTVTVAGSLKVDSAHVGQVADIFVYAEATLPPDPTVLYFMLDVDGGVLSWDRNPAHLAAFLPQVTLGTAQYVPMYRGQFIYPGTLKVYFGYRLADGTVVTSEQPIDIMIN